MVAVQIFCYGHVADTRVRRKSARAAAKAERERIDKVRANQRKKGEGLSVSTANGHIDSVDGNDDTPTLTNGGSKFPANGYSSPKLSAPSSMVMADVSDTDESVLETSSEEEPMH